MYHVSFPPQSNRASWIFIGEVLDMDDTPVNISGCSMAFRADDTDGGQRLLATTGNGKITFVDIGKFRWEFTRGEMSQLEPGTYNTGLTLTNDDGTQTIQLSVGPLPIVEGVAR
jgi:hypothetical protein